MSDEITVRVALGRYDTAGPSEQQTRIDVQIPEVARASWLLPEDHFRFSQTQPWPSVVDSAQEYYEQNGTVTGPDSAATRRRVMAWLADDANRDEMQAAYEADQALWDPTVRRLEAENAELRARVAELEAAPAFVYRAEHPDAGIVLGTYSSREAAVAHCEALARREGSTGLVSWVPDDGDALSPEELTFFDVEYCDGDDVPVQTCTGYVVTPVQVLREPETGGA